MSATSIVASSVVIVLLSTSRVIASDSPQVTARVDSLMRQAWSAAGVEPAAVSKDSEFLRRVYLDLTGAIPRVSEVRRFLDDPRPDKRARLIDELLKNPNHARHLANVWRDIMLPRNNTARVGGLANLFERWLQENFEENAAYDAVASQLLTAQGQLGQSGPVLYYAALELKPEELAASTSRIFLGVQIQCAQCHAHPFDSWTQEDFWGYAAFFAQLGQSQERRGTANLRDAEMGEVTLPDSQEIVLPRFLGSEQAWKKSSESRRDQLARWVTSADNPYFARATVNRVWSLLFGRGLVDPVDDFGEHNLPSHPEVLDALSADFVTHGFDLRRLFRVLTNTQAYQLSSASDSNSPLGDPQMFARMAVKSLSGEQIYACLQQAIGRDDRLQNTAAGVADRNRQTFLAKFEAPAQSATDFQAGIPQTLTMLNGREVADATDLGKSAVLTALTDAPFFSVEQRVEVLFLATLSRLPTQQERENCVSYVEAGGPTSDSDRALADVLWALLNAAEFILNH